MYLQSPYDLPLQVIIKILFYEIFKGTKFQHLLAYLSYTYNLVKIKI